MNRNNVIPIPVPFLGWTALDAFLPHFNSLFKGIVEELGLEIVGEPSVESGVEFIAFYPAGEDCEIQFSLIVSPLFEVPEGGNTLEMVKFRLWSALGKGNEIYEFFLDPYSSSLQEQFESLVRSLRSRSLEPSERPLNASTEALR